MPDVGTGIGAGISLLSGKKASDDSKRSSALQREQLALERERDAFNRDQITQMNEWAREDRADIMSRRDRARGIYDPLEESIVDLATAGPDYAGAMGRSDADVAQAYGVMREQEGRRRQRYGINNPYGGSTGEAARRIGNAEALAKVAGRNLARLQEDDKDWSRRIAAMGSGNMRNANASTQLAQLGVSGASGVLSDMSSAAGANAAGAASFGGKIFADTMSGKYSWNPSGMGSSSAPFDDLNASPTDFEASLYG